ncbi:SDR family NAD(P)-dependent oxidoreductase [Croceicoccus sp. F390]|uniref:SDR family NAD(P)-dependent oxidoreductase n=1 Tax=Croceicoccus esteveae TaxID=3075597 RepID=A0ABU2ZGR3_9SPHN|nr:SDR family NAD(P)-dependent oxidoreductase [Croceicoccus sp. F390]MDT0574607.1 SDR family NAD(P)-dependent oxidoreductase [Croceicoccus sp. F390]
MRHMLIFGLGYSAKRICHLAHEAGWTVTATGRDGMVDFADTDRVRSAIAGADVILSSVPPSRTDGDDPVLLHYGAQLERHAGWIGYLSSTGVYGDRGGAWVDESTPVGSGRRSARVDADAHWLALGARVFRLPGIYGPGRSALDRVREGKAHRIDLPEQVFSRIHVEDLARGVIAGLDAPAGAYNLADRLPASHNAVVEEACRLLHRKPPAMQTLEEADLSPMARGFYAENRRVANVKAKRVLGWYPAFPTFREGLVACLTDCRAHRADPVSAGI